MRNYYIYIHIKPDGEIFYVGKGKGDRAYSKYRRSDFWTSTVTKYGYDVFILEKDLNEAEAFKIEINYIKRIGRRDLGLGTLVNMTNGGEGISGLIFSDEHKRKIGDAQKGEKNHNYGKSASNTTRKKMSDSGKGRIVSDETKKKIGAANKIALTGKKLSEEHRQKISDGSTIKRSVIDTSTGIIYSSIMEAAKESNIIYGTLRKYLIGTRKNKTTLKFYNYGN